MKNRQKKILIALIIMLFVMLGLTVAFFVIGCFGEFKEIKNAQSGVDLFGPRLAIVVYFFLTVIMAFSEISLFFNFRYFLNNSSKKSALFILNILMIPFSALSIVFESLFLFNVIIISVKFIEFMIFISFSLLLVLRAVYFFYILKESDESYDVRTYE